MEAEVDRLLALYERRTISRRGLVEAVAAMALTGRAVEAATSPRASPMVRGRTLNHVTIVTGDVARSKAFYQRLAGLPVRQEGPGFCDLRLENGFLGLYAPWAPQLRHGIDHVCLGIDGYRPEALLAQLKSEMPETKPTVEFGDQLYIRDPDGAKVQFAGTEYKQ